jgi:serine/threonine-protein kinase RsbW
MARLPAGYGGSRQPEECSVDPRPVDSQVLDHRPFGPVALTLPADTRMARVARLTASALGALADFTVDDIDDLRIGVDELVVSLIELGRGDPIDLYFDIVGDAVGVRGTTTRSDDEPEAERFSLSERILAVVADEYEVAEADGLITIRLVKRSLPS